MKEAIHYIDRIKNEQKRKYAAAWFNYRRGFYGAPDFLDFGVSYMAAQGVRLQLDALLNVSREQIEP